MRTTSLTFLYCNNLHLCLEIICENICMIMTITETLALLYLYGCVWHGHFLLISHLLSHNIHFIVLFLVIRHKLNKSWRLQNMRSKNVLKTNYWIVNICFQMYMYKAYLKKKTTSKFTWILPYCKTPKKNHKKIITYSNCLLIFGICFCVFFKNNVSFHGVFREFN